MSPSEIKERRPISSHPRSISIKADGLLHALPHPVIVLRGDDRVVYVNFSSEVFFGISETLLRRRKLGSLVTFASPLLALVKQVRQTNATINEYAIDLGLPDTNTQKSVDVFAAPLQEYENHVLIMLQQRTIAKMIERQLNHRGAARSVSGMAAVLAHEIKNPLSGIRGAAQLLEAGATAEDRPLAQLICKETDRICNLVDRMEVFGDERPLKREPVNIHTVLDHVRQLAQNGISKGILITQDYDPSLPPVLGNSDKLIQAFLNLVKNSAEAIDTDRNDGHIRLTTAFRPGLWISLPNSDKRVQLPLEITVTDNGTGIPNELKHYLFDPFVTTKSGGTGLGLALVAKIVGDHGGTIECETKPKQTVFRIMMPMFQNSRETK